MNICLLGDFSAGLDEGYKNTCHYLSAALAENHLITRLNIRRFAPEAYLRIFRDSNPDIIHTLAQPTCQSLLFTRALKCFFPPARTVVSALRPGRFFVESRLSYRRLVMKIVKPDMIFIQDRSCEPVLARLGCRFAYVPNGVDLSKFKPVDSRQKTRLRARHGFGPDSPLVLHVGHLEAARNILALKPLVEAEIQVVIVGSLYNGTHAALIDELQAAGFHVIAGYQPHVEEYYQLSDCYIFPVKPGNSLAMPLSVLEAMACNLPVIATEFQGLRGYINEAGGFVYLDNLAHLTSVTRELLQSPIKVENRKMVERFSWQAIAQEIGHHYSQLLAGNTCN